MSSQLPDSPVNRLIQFSDCHLGQDDQFKLAGINTARSLNSVLSALKSDLPNCDLLTVSGDIAADGQCQAYELFASLLPATQPLAWLPGNHDDFPVMQRSLPWSFRRVVELDGWVAIFLVSAVPGKVAGKLDERELAELEQLLGVYSQYHVALFVHHPPARVNCRWLDKQRIGNEQALAALLSRFTNVRAIFCGHVHQSYSTDWEGVPVYTVPSTCFQFASGSDEFELCDQGPGYRWIHLYGDGRIDTGVTFVDCDEQHAARRCMGY